MAVLKKIYEFIVENWSLISGIIVSIIALIISLVKAKDKTKQFELLEVFIEDMILMAEEQFGVGTGDVKKSFVLNMAKEFAKKIKVSISDDDLSEKIEKLLSLPLKKWKEVMPIRKRRVGGRKDKKIFSKTAARTKSINVVSMARGGVRL